MMLDKEVNESKTKENIVRYSLKNPNFVKIKAGAEVYYGGNQSWFDAKIAQDSACGTIAACNILVYLGIWGGMSEKYSSFYNENMLGYAPKEKAYTIEEYKQLMNKVYKYLYPINISYPRGGLDLFYKFMCIFHLSDLSLGIPSAYRFSRGVLETANSKWVGLEAELYPKRLFSAWTEVAAREFISSALVNDRPVALLNTFNKDLKGFEYESEKMGRSRGDFDMHWVIITEMEVDKISRKTYLYVSSWGEKVRMDLADILKGGMLKRMLCFKKINLIK